MSNTINAVIEKAEIRIERGIILTAWLTLDFGGNGQGFGGYALYLNPTAGGHEKAKKHNYAGIFIHKVLEIADVESWDELAGKTIRVEKESSWGPIIRIGHIVKDLWFDPKAEFEEKEGES